MLHIVDHFSKFSMVGISDGTGLSVVRLLRRWAAVFGKPPTAFISDNGPEFDNEVLRQHLSFNDVRMYRTPVYTPRSAGTVERHNGVLKALLRKLADVDVREVFTIEFEDLLLEAVI